MTIDEALEKVRRTEACWIVWNTDSGEILSVTGTAADASPQDLFRHLQGLSASGAPVKTRHFQSRSVTRQLLVQESEETDRFKTRGSVLTAWSGAPVEELLQLLERGDYPPPMQKDFDSKIIVDHLWKAHRDELVAATQRRLHALAGTALLCASASRNLHAYLLALDGDEETLAAIWRRERPGRTCYADAYVLMDCFAHLQISDRSIINDITDIIEQPGFFGPRHEAMLALGRLGKVAGSRAAAVIRNCIYDSSPQLTARRDRVLQRIEATGADWVRCGSCCYGRVHCADSHSTEACPECLGLGYLPGQTGTRGRES
jgi:hypothetical protein